jgi:hypothetical protein
MMRRFLLPLALLAPAAAWAQNAPFCVVSGAGTQCYYWNAPSCQSAARSMQGICVVNQQQQQSPQPMPNNYESWSRARENGAQRTEQERKPVGTTLVPTSKEGFSWDDFRQRLGLPATNARTDLRLRERPHPSSGRRLHRDGL